MIRMSDSIFFRCHQKHEMPIIKIFKKILIPEFFIKMRALEKWCVTKVAHCIRYKRETECSKLCDKRNVNDIIYKLNLCLANESGTFYEFMIILPFHRQKCTVKSN